MTDNYKQLRDALAAGPKPGKWTWKQVGSFSTPGYAVLWPDTSKGGTHYRRIDSGGGMEQVDADYISAAHPEALRALLAERDAFRDALLWNAAALQACCAEGIREASNITIESKTKCFAEILDMADAALAQEQGENNGATK